MSRKKYVIGSTGACWSFLLFRWRDDNTAIGYVPFFTSLKINGSRQFFVAVQGAARDAWDFFVIDDGLAILNDGDPTPDQRDIEGLPFSRLAGHFRRGRQETVYAAHVVTRWFLDAVGFELDLVPDAQINASIGICPTIEFDMQLEI